MSAPVVTIDVECEFCSWMHSMSETFVHGPDPRRVEMLQAEAEARLREHLTARHPDDEDRPN